MSIVIVGGAGRVGAPLTRLLEVRGYDVPSSKAAAAADTDKTKPSSSTPQNVDPAELDRELDEALEESFPSSDPVAVDPRRFDSLNDVRHQMYKRVNPSGAGSRPQACGPR